MRTVRPYGNECALWGYRSRQKIFRNDHIRMVFRRCGSVHATLHCPIDETAGRSTGTCTFSLWYANRCGAAAWPAVEIETCSFHGNICMACPPVRASIHERPVPIRYRIPQNNIRTAFASVWLKFLRNTEISFSKLLSTLTSSPQFNCFVVHLPFGFFADWITVPWTASWCRFKFPVRLKFLPHSLHACELDWDGTSVRSARGWMASTGSPTVVVSLLSILLRSLDLAVLFWIFSKSYKSSSSSSSSSTVSHSTTAFWSSRMDLSNDVELGAISSSSTSIGCTKTTGCSIPLMFGFSSVSQVSSGMKMDPSVLSSVCQWAHRLSPLPIHTTIFRCTGIALLQQIRLNAFLFEMMCNFQVIVAWNTDGVVLTYLLFRRNKHNVNALYTFHSQRLLGSTYFFDARHKCVHFVDSIRMMEYANHAIALITARLARR